MSAHTQDHDKQVATIRAMIASHKRKDMLFAASGILCLAIGLFVFIALLGKMFMDGSARINLDFMLNYPSRIAEDAGILSAWVGSVSVMVVTICTAVPIGIGAGVYLEEYAPKNWFTDIIEINVTNLAGVPSIVYGLFALGLFVYYFGFGRSVLSAGLTLSLLVLPVVIVATREAIRTIPSMIREGAYALGATKWQTIADHILPYSMSGILTGIIIGLARAIGETAPIITIAWVFVAFLPEVSFSQPFAWLSADFTVLPIQMFQWVDRPEEEFHTNAAAAGVVLLLMTLSMNALAIYLRYQLRKNIKW